MSAEDSPQSTEDYPQIPVVLSIGCTEEEIGTVTTDPDHWRPALAALLRDSADILEGTTCPEDS